MNLLLKDLLKIAETRFEREGCLTPRLDAEQLFMHMVDRDKAWLFLHYGDDIDDKTCEEYFKLVDIRAEGMPVQYITGSQEFMGLPFMVNKNVLIPRQDTETLVERALDLVKGKKMPMRGFRILDLCSGSGAIAVSLSYHLNRNGKKTFITATDISPAAIAVATENARLNGVAKDITFVEGDLFAPFIKNKKGRGKQQFDFIISNPPYIPSHVIPTLMREVRDHEPTLALDGGNDGLDIYRRILNEVHLYLKKSGVLLMEIGYDQGEAIVNLVADSGFYGPAKIIKDLGGKDRVVMIELAESAIIPLEGENGIQG
jgi:release factor glutamine methyltransferase